MALLPLSACASTGQWSQAKLVKTAQNTSCENPLILKYVADDVERFDVAKEGGQTLSRPEKELLLHTAKVRSLGYEDAEPVSNSVCEGLSIQVYKTVELSEEQGGMVRLYVKPMTAEQIKADPNVTCKPTYTQVYQPPLKLGGAGRVIQVRNGEKCEVVNRYL